MKFSKFDDNYKLKESNEFNGSKCMLHECTQTHSMNKTEKKKTNLQHA